MNTSKKKAMSGLLARLSVSVARTLRGKTRMQILIIFLMSRLLKINKQEIPRHGKLTDSTPIIRGVAALQGAITD
ncbi:hypothetical protein D3C75_1123410 [compost metagenome]